MNEQSSRPTPTVSTVQYSFRLDRNSVFPELQLFVWRIEYKIVEFLMGTKTDWNYGKPELQRVHANEMEAVSYAAQE